MGYDTDFDGRINIQPPLNPKEIHYLYQFACTRHMIREQGPYYVDGLYGRDTTGVNVAAGHVNEPPPGQPSLWCNFQATADGTALIWNQTEKTYYAEIWIAYLIDHFLKPGAEASKTGMEQFKGFTFDHICNGKLLAQGEDIHDRWKIVVTNNLVTVIKLE